MTSRPTGGCRKGPVLERRERGQQPQAGLALARRAHGGEGPLGKPAVGAEALLAGEASALEREDGALGQLALPEPEPEEPLGDLQCVLRGGEEDAFTGLARPERTTDATGKVDRAALALVDPRCRHRAAELFEGLAPGPEALHEREDRLRVHCHRRLVPLNGMPPEDLLVVQDDPVVDTHDVLVAD